MEVAPGPLARTYTAPPASSSHSRLQNSTSSSRKPEYQSHTVSSFSSYTVPSRSSDSTQHTSVSTFPAPPSSASTALNGGQVNASNSVINKVAAKETSLFQSCVTLRKRLSKVNGFDEEVAIVEEEEAEVEEGPLDPVTILWRTFRRGYPLMMIYNALQPEVPLAVDEQKLPEARRGKAAAFKFVQACVNKLQFRTEDCFILADLFGDDTSGFLKVAKVVSRVVDILNERGLIDILHQDDLSENDSSFVKRTKREHIIDELVRTERTYVEHLQLLQDFKKHVETRNVITGDAVHAIFLNLDALLDFQRRFLIRVEQTNSLPDSEQNWGQLFKTFGPSFRVYESYIANQKNCEATALQEFPKLSSIEGSADLRSIIESPPILNSFLVKPFQRLAKYPLLLAELRDKGDLDDARREDVEEGIQAVTEILQRTNTFLHQQERLEALQELKDQVEDWKDHKVEAFGQLLLHGKFTVFKNDANGSEREYKMYLFEKILLCCKDITNKPKNKIKSSSNLPAKGKPRMAMKGRIFMQNVTDVFTHTKPAHYTLQIMWKGDSAIEYFVVRFPTEDLQKTWSELLQKQKKECHEMIRRNHSTTGTSDSQFISLRNQANLENPYKEDEETFVDEDAQYNQYDPSGVWMNRHGSETSLRSRSTTGDSGPNMSQLNSKAPPTKYSGMSSSAPLTLRTQQLQGGESYFSPTVDTPISSRTSSSSGMTPFPRQSTPSNGGNSEEHNRFTAPVGMARPFGKDLQNGYYPVDPRIPRPPNGPMMYQAALAQTRLRSASSPDVHAQNVAPRVTPPNAPPVPTVPSHLTQHQGTINRSQSNSPIYGNGVPSRAAAQSPSSKLKMPGQQPAPLPFQPPHGYDRGYGRNPPSQIQTQWDSGTISPPLGSAFSTLSDNSNPTNFKVRVELPSKGSHTTLVVGFNINYQSLKDRIDAKLQRHTDLSLQSGTLKLQYEEGGDYITITCDEDVQSAFETYQGAGTANPMAEVVLYCNT